MTGTEQYEGFRQKLILSVQSAMALVPCQCGRNNLERVCDDLLWISKFYELQVCPDAEKQIDRLKGVEDQFYPHQRIKSTRNYSNEIVTN